MYYVIDESTINCIRVGGPRQRLEPVHNDEHILTPTESEIAKITAQLNLQPVDKNRFDICKVTKDCELREFVEERKLEFKRGRVFYEFEHDFEYIADDKRLLLMNKVSDILLP